MSHLPTRQMIVSVPEGGEAVLTFPADPLTLETLDMLEQHCALMFRSLRRKAIEKMARDCGDAEYESWSATQPEAKATDEPSQ